METVSYKCPNCAAGLSFDIDRQNWHCGFCGGDFTLAQLDSPPETPPDFEAPRDTYGGGAAAFSCPSCGGRIITDQNTAATFCVYCHNPTVIAARLENEFRPARLIPFKLKKDTVMDALLKYCRRRPLLPSDFREYAKRGEVSGLYVPFWLFSADVDASLRGTAQRVSTWSDSRYRYTKTDTYRVERDAHMTFVNIPADGSSRMDDALMDSLEPFDYAQMVDFSMQYLSGHFAESYDVDANEAARRAMPRMRKSVEQMMRATVTGYTTNRIDELSSRPKNAASTYVMLPVWVLMADYGGKRYTFAMNGQTGKLTGALPISRARFWAWFGGISAVAFAIACIGGLLL